MNKFHTMEKINILMVDDQPGKLLTYETVLAELDENLLRATSAREALDQLLRHEVGVILIDVCMPELDGFELAAMIREHPRFERTAIIFVSAVQITELDRLKGYEAGAVDYVPVPVVPELLRAKVRVFADLFRKTRQLELVNLELELRVSERTAALKASSEQLKLLNEQLECRIEQRTREREEALAQLLEAQKIDTIGRLTGGVAHDFNNLLMVVLGSLEILQKRIENDPRSLRLVDNAIQGAKRGASLTQRLLAFARRQELKPQPVELGKLVAGIEELLARALGPSISLLLRIPRELALVNVDANQLELALLNLAVNARDAMPVSGTLTISASNEASTAHNGLKQLPVGSFVCLRVIDDGVGMDHATLARASEPFFTTKGPGKGTGLGLSMVHGLAAQSGGGMKIKSVAGEGTTVEIWLPAAEATAPLVEVVRESGAAPGGARRKLHILLVDDDSLVRDGTTAMLEELGHSVWGVASGDEALTTLENGLRVDLIITDHAMPGILGSDLCERLQRLYPDLPLILATGYAELPDVPQFASPIRRLTKPYRLDELDKALASINFRESAKVAPLCRA